MHIKEEVRRRARILTICFICQYGMAYVMLMETLRLSKKCSMELWALCAIACDSFLLSRDHSLVCL